LRSSKRFVLTIIVLLASVLPAFASGGSDCQELNCSTFFSPFVIQSPYESVLFRTPRRIHTRELTTQMEVINLKEWSAYLGNSIPDDQLTTLLYKLSIEELNILQSSGRQPSGTQNRSLAALRDAILANGNRDRFFRSLEYLQLAKGVEPLATANLQAEWSYPPKPKPVITVDTEKLIAEANFRIPSSDAFLAGRYRFQILRMLFYKGQYTEAQKYYEQFGSTYRNESSVRYRFMELAGGAYAREKKFGQANYLFSLVFDRFPQMKASSYLSFHPMEDADWKETLKLAKNNREREVLWQLLGIYADGMSAIDNIYAINPQSNLLPLLLVREVNIVEERWTSNQYRLHAEGGRPDSDRNVVGVKRLDRIRQIANEGKAHKPYLWLLATGHLLALAGDTAEANLYLQRASNASPAVADVRDQVRASTLFARVVSTRAIDKAAEPFFATELRWLKGNGADKSNFEARNLETWALTRLSDIYKEGGDHARSLMLGNRWSETYQSSAAVDAILNLMQKPGSAFDRFLMVNYQNKETNIQELRAIHFMYAGDFDKALETLKLAGPVANAALNANPFIIHNRDCLSCDAAPPHTTYSRVTFAERMRSLSRTAQGRDAVAASASFELANGFYNMSYYGNIRSMANFTDLRIGIYRPRNDSFPTLNMDMAEKYYLQAASLSTDREFKAKALFMAAKAEQNRNTNLGGPTKATNPRRHFAALRDSFKDTTYYQEIIRECGYFRAFLAR
jgi:hypothetical protein